MVKKAGARPRIASILILALLGPAAPANAQDLIEPTRHWAYASFFGTGWYKINDQRSAFILRASPRWTVGDASISEGGEREIAYTFRVPLTMGFANLDFEDIPGFLDPDNYTTASVGFSVDADIPITRRFSVRPSGEVGYGTILDESEYAWNYKAEIKSRYTFQAGELDWALLFDVGIAGFEPNRGASDDFSFAAAGAEFGYPVSWFSREDSQTMLYWHVAFTDFLDEIEVRTGIQEFDSVANYWQIGAALGRRDQPVRIWFLSFDRLGLAYKINANSELRGINFVFRSLYEL
jgi:hypothetical protein